MNADEIAGLIFSKYIDANFKQDCEIFGAYGVPINNNRVRCLFWIKYFSDKTQEKEINDRISNIRKELNIDEKSDYEKVESINNYIVKNVKYNESKETLYDAVVLGEANCVGYSRFFGGFVRNIISVQK